MRVTHKLLAIFMTAILIATGLGGSARAQGLDLTTSPLPISASAKPGTSITVDLRIKNDAPETQRLKVGLLKFTAYGEEGKPALQEREPGDDYFDWVTFAPAAFDAPSGVWQTVKMTISLPQD